MKSGSVKMNSKLKKTAQFLGLNRSMGAMLVMVILLGMGEKMGERFLPIYLLAIGGSVYAVGFLNALDNFLSAIYSWIGGYVSDKVGYKKALMIYTGFSIFGYLIIILFPSWQAVLIGAIFFISWTALSLPAILSLVSSTLKKEKQTMGVSMHSIIRRIPMAIGPLAGGILIQMYGILIGARIAFVVALIFAILSLIFIYLYIEDKQEKSIPVINVIDTFKQMPKPLRTLLLSDILIRFAEQIPYAFVVVWIMQTNQQSAVSFSLLTMIEMAVAMIIYIPVAYLSEKISNKTIVSITFGFFTIFPLVLLFSTGMPMLIFAFIIRGLKEFGEPTRKALIVKLANEGSKATTFGTYYLLRDIVVSIASLFSASLWLISPQTNFLTASAFGLLGTMIFVVYGKDKRNGDEASILSKS
jgi:MFS family permease